MKLSFKLRPRRALTRAEAWGCLTANLALPGAGSLAAGRVVGYAQMALAFAGMIVTVVAAVSMFKWMESRGGSQPSVEDPMQNLAELWIHIRWPLVGFGMFAASLLWGLVTSWSLLAGASPTENVPPRIPPRI